jgi:ribonuclease T2
MRAAALLAFLVLAAVGPGARAEVPGFDYYLLAISWTPNWCVAEGDARADARCEAGAGWGWGLHGLWPQHERGWPEYCPTPHRPASRAETAAMGDVMGSSGLAWHQWRKHGVCSGLSAAEYFEASRRAFERIVLPEVFGQIDRRVRLPAHVVEEAFLEANPGLTGEMLTVTCRAGGIQEVRICLTRDLEPRACAPDVARDCTLDRAVMEPVR